MVRLLRLRSRLQALRGRLELLLGAADRHHFSEFEKALDGLSY
jgi:hypothetical protein